MRFRSQIGAVFGRGTKVKTSLSNLVVVGYMRHLHNTRERGPRRGPDRFVRFFLSPYRVRHAMGQDMKPLRAKAFYHFLLARTRFYDEILLHAVGSGIRQVLILGAGIDTRAYRFERELVRNDVQVIEADQVPTITEKRNVAHQLKDYPYVRWVELDLETVSWPEWANRAGLLSGTPTFVMMEGVAPYITEGAYVHAIRSLCKVVGPSSRFGLDFKMAGHSDESGRFRLPDDAAAITKFHEDLGLRPTLILRGAEVHERYNHYSSPTFAEDGILHAET